MGCTVASPLKSSYSGRSFQLMSFTQYTCVYECKVLEIIEEPIECNPCEMRVSNYLQQYIGNMRKDEVRRFLRFTTGSSVLIAERITIAFNGATGLLDIQ